MIEFYLTALRVIALITFVFAIFTKDVPAANQKILVAIFFLLCAYDPQFRK